MQCLRKTRNKAMLKITTKIILFKEKKIMVNDNGKKWLRNLIIMEIFMKTTCKTYFVAYFFFFFLDMLQQCL